MNFLAKHFFEYQSFINLPHTAVQMHKTPPSQAGADPSASWAPKDLHTAGKNQAAPAARANRNYHGDQRTGSHRHGRPSKLEFRSWGERHGELREEKIVPHKDHWMEAMEDGKRSSSLDGMHGMHARGAADHFPSDYFPRALQTQQSLDTALSRATAAQMAPNARPMRLLVILTVSPHLDFISVTVKAIRGLGAKEKDPLIQLRLFDGHRLVEERGPSKGTSKEHPSTIQATPEAGDERPIGQSFLLRAPSPLRLPFCQLALSLFAPGPKAEALPLLGICLLGPSGTVSRGNSHWRQMIKKLGVPIAMWHDVGGQQLLGSPNTRRIGGIGTRQRTTAQQQQQQWQEKREKVDGDDGQEELASLQLAELSAIEGKE